MDVRLLTRAPIKRWQVLIKNSLGEVVRSYSGWDTPPLRMTWDGLDDAGRLVSDGRYTYEIIVVDQRNRPLQYSGSLTQIRTRGPRGRMEIRPGQQ
jgi:flagellar hook assembly protein FlgD